MNRAKRRQHDRAMPCALCGRPMTQADRVRFTKPSLNPECIERPLGHSKCVAAAAMRRANAAETAVKNMSAAAGAIAESQRAQALGLWVPS